MAEIRRVRHGGDARLLVLESMVVLGVAVVVCYSQSNQIYRWLTTALPRGHRQLYTFSPGETEGNAIRIALFSGMLLTLPVVAYRVSERALPTTGQLDPMLLAVPLLAVLGIVAGWAVVVPVAYRQLVTLQSDVVQYLPRARDDIDFTMGILLASGIGGASLGAFALRRAA
jgi:Sec-independent protein secretion pathway component TatC